MPVDGVPRIGTRGGRFRECGVCRTNGRHREIRLYSSGTVLGTDCPRTMAYINGLWRTMQVEKWLRDAKSPVRRRSLGNVPEPSDSVYLGSNPSPEYSVAGISDQNSTIPKSCSKSCCQREPTCEQVHHVHRVGYIVRILEET